MGENKRVITKWLYWFVFAVAVILVYKTVDNLGEILNWFGKLFSILMPFVIGILIAYLFYMPTKKLEKVLARSALTNSSSFNFLKSALFSSS